jgi:ubiquinone/menaquinone biosynthesis C-methylase UbiE
VPHYASIRLPFIRRVFFLEPASKQRYIAPRPPVSENVPMKIHDPKAYFQATELEIIQRTLPLQGKRVLELGCGRAWMTRRLAEDFAPAEVIATEVDPIQHGKNLRIDDLPNVTFVYGGAESIDQPDAGIDVVLMLKSLHHVPEDLMGKALEEIARVLRPGGLAYISEPVYSGDFNEILRLFNDEQSVREKAFGAVRHAVETGTLELVEQIFFNSPGHYRDFAAFEDRMLKVTHTRHEISPDLYQQIRNAFMQHMTEKGAYLGPISSSLRGWIC